MRIRTLFLTLSVGALCAYAASNYASRVYHGSTEPPTIAAMAGEVPLQPVLATPENTQMVASLPKQDEVAPAPAETNEIPVVLSSPQPTSSLSDPTPYIQVAGGEGGYGEGDGGDGGYGGHEDGGGKSYGHHDGGGKKSHHSERSPPPVQGGGSPQALCNNCFTKAPVNWQERVMIEGCENICVVYIDTSGHKRYHYCRKTGQDRTGWPRGIEPPQD